MSLFACPKSRKHGLAAMAAAIVLTAVAAPTPASAYVDPTGTTSTTGTTQITTGTSRVITAGASGVRVKVTDEGDCDRVQVETTLLPPTKARTLVTEARYSFDDHCRVTLNGTRTIDQATFRKTNNYTGKTATATRGKALTTTSGKALTVTSSKAATTTSGRAAATKAAAVVVYGNYAHTSQTVQDVVFIDIAKLQYHADRNWDRNCSWWRPDRWARSSTSVSWNHAEKPTFGTTGGTACNNAWTSTAASANFHSDWLWCNFTANWQKLSLTNTNFTRSDGTAGASWKQSRACPGTHMATRVWANTNRNG